MSIQMRGIHRLAAFLKRIGLSAAGQLLVSAANLLLGLSFMVLSEPETFGTFAFTQTVAFLGFGISNAVLSSPLMATLHRDVVQRAGLVESYFLASFLLSGLCGFLVFGLAAALFDLSMVASVGFGVSTALLVSTRLPRTFMLDGGQGGRVLFADVSYAVVLIAAGIGVSLDGHIDLVEAAFSLLAAAIACWVSLLPSVGRRVLNIGAGALSSLKDGFQRHGRHALIGVLSTEMTGRAHAYVVTLWLGPAEFAPLAAAMLFFRPVSIALASLTQYERASVARLLRAADRCAVSKEIRYFQASAAFLFVINVAVALGVLMFLPPQMLAKYDTGVLTVAVLLVGVAAAFQTLRTPASTLLQADGDFRSLANATVIASVVSLALVLLTVGSAGALWSMSGVIVGEAVAAALIIMHARKRIGAVRCHGPDR